MNEAITQDQLKIKCNITIKKVLDLDIHEQPNRHSTAVLKAMLDSEEGEALQSKLSGQPLIVYYLKDDKEVYIFNGVIHKAIVTRKADCHELLLQAYSLSWLLDLEKKSRSFQDVNQTYVDLIFNILEEYDAQAIYKIPDDPIGKPLIQYQETDWEFICRIVSRFHVSTVPASNQYVNGIYLGVPGRQVKAELDNPVYSWCLDIDHNREDGIDKWQSAYYQVTCTVPLHIIEAVKFKNRVLRVYDVRIRLCQNVLEFTCQLAEEEKFRIPPFYNASLQGLTLAGTVLERQNEEIKLHLDIDDEQTENKAYFYPWRPETGNILYSMPQTGSRAALYMQNANEWNAIAIHCLRQNGAVCPETQEPADRYLVTEDQMKMSIKPETMDLRSTIGGSAISLDDGFGSRFNSSKEFLIEAKGKLNIIGSDVVVKAPEEITTVRRQIGTPSVINFCHNVDAVGGKGKFTNNPLPAAARIPAGSGASAADTKKAGSANSSGDGGEKKKLKFKMADASAKKDKPYDISGIYQNIFAAVPRTKEEDVFTRLASGSQIMSGKMRGE